MNVGLVAIQRACCAYCIEASYCSGRRTFRIEKSLNMNQEQADYDVTGILSRTWSGRKSEISYGPRLVRKELLRDESRNCIPCQILNDDGGDNLLDNILVYHFWSQRS